MSDYKIDIVNRFETNGIPVNTIREVSAMDDEKEVVYKISTDRKTLFVRTVRPSREAGIKQIIGLNIDFGIPESKFIDGDPGLFVMEPAEGRPLSVLLPVYLFPGIWRSTANDLKSGFKALGRYHSRLHTVTMEDTVRLGESARYGQKLRLSDMFRSRLGPTFDQLVPWTERAKDIRATRARIHSDPTPHNVYFKNGDVDLIDVDLRLAVTVKDRMAVECGIELMTERLPYGRRSQANQLIDSYYQGYNINEFPDDFPHWVYLTLKAVHYCSILEQYIQGDRDAYREYLTSIVDESIITHQVEDLVNALNNV